MNGYLKQSTASQTRWVGPFVDDTDFKTAKTGLTIANTDIKVSKNGGSSASKNSGGGTHDVNGMYAVTWDATDTATVGEFSFSIKVAGALAVFGTYVVLEEAVYDALFAASALGYVANAPVNVAQFGGSNGTFASGRPEVNTTHWKGTTAATADTAGYPVVTVKDGTGAGEIALTSGAVDTVTTLTNAPSDSLGVTTLLSRLTALRAGYLDNLSAGAVALASTFTGITSLAQWLGLLAGKQTGNTTARTELRASGAGSGTFDETTDSQEAIRDRGDSAWTTAVGFATHTAADVWAVATRLLTAGTNIVLAKGTGVTGFNDLSAAQVNAEADQALADVGVTSAVTGRIDVATSTRASQTSVDTVDSVADAILVDTAEIGTAGAGLTALASAANLATLDAVADAIRVTTDKLDDTLEDDAGTFRFTTNALEQAPSGGGSAPTAAEIADAVWEEALADHENTAGSTAAALAQAGGSGASASQIADAVWDELASGHTIPGSMADQIGDILADTAQIGTAGGGLGQVNRANIRAGRVVVFRGEEAIIPFDLDLGSPTPVLRFTLARERNMTPKIWDGTPTVGSPGYLVTVPTSITNREPGTYWWDLWNMDTETLLALGTLVIQSDVRLP